MSNIFSVGVSTKIVNQCKLGKNIVLVWAKNVLEAFVLCQKGWFLARVREMGQRALQAA